MDNTTNIEAANNFSQLSGKNFKTRLPQITPAIPVTDNNKIERLIFCPGDLRMIWTEENRLKSVITGIRVLIGMKCTNNGNEKRANPKPVVPLTIPERNTTHKMAIQTDTGMNIKNKITIANKFTTILYTLL